MFVWIVLNWSTLVYFGLCWSTFIFKSFKRISEPISINSFHAWMKGLWFLTFCVLFPFAKELHFWTHNYTFLIYWLLLLLVKNLLSSLPHALAKLVFLNVELHHWSFTIIKVSTIYNFDTISKNTRKSYIAFGVLYFCNFNILRWFFMM